MIRLHRHDKITRAVAPWVSTRNRYSLEMAALLGVISALCVTEAGSKEARAAVFWNPVRWPQSTQGYTVIPVCMVSGSSAVQSPDGGLAGLIVEPNPSLGQVITHVRSAISKSWEVNTSLRFVGWKDCDSLSAYDRMKAVGLKIHRDSDNASNLGTQARGQNPGTNFKPWGQDFNRCIKYNAATTHVEYTFDCVEQYAIHEFGHQIGFLHEWSHPLVPSGCPNREPVGTSDYSSSYPNTSQYTIFNASSYDWNSVMTYWDGCVHQVGVRFGSVTVNANDAYAANHIYPPAGVGNYDVGVIASTEGKCGGGEPITIYMDDEDADNIDAVSGWVGGIHVDRNSWLTLCRIDGQRLGKAAPSSPGRRDGDYAVLKLGASCPAGSVDFTRYFDNEDDHNENYAQGVISPSTQDRNTTLRFCLFRPETSGGTEMTSFPELGFSYGVFAAANFTKRRTSGWVFTDDEDYNNANQLTAPDANTSSAAQLIIEAGRNTKMYVAGTRCGSLEPGQSLVTDQSVTSCDGRFTLVMQDDGNLVLYQLGVGGLWSSGTWSTTGRDARMQSDGNFVLYNASSAPLWASGTWNHPGSTLAVQNDGNVVVYSPSGAPLWASGTCCR